VTSLKLLNVRTPALLLVGVLMAFSTSSDAIQVTRLVPEPNYPLSTDSDDKRQLTDGKLSRFPIWVRKESVAWQWAKQVEIDVNVSESRGRETSECARATLGFVTAKHKKADVQVPWRIDVYSRVDSNSSAHVGGITVQDDGLEDELAHKIDVPIFQYGDSLKVVVVTRGVFFALDEIELNAENDCASANGEELHLVRDVRGDSLARLKETLNKAESSRLASRSSRDSFRAWIQNSWDTLEEFPQRDHPAETRLGVSGGEKPRFVVGVSGDCPTSEAYELVVASRDLSEREFKIYEVAPVLSYDGSVVYDPMIKLSRSRLPCRKGRASYAWIETNPTQKSGTSFPISIVVRSVERSKELHAIIEKMPDVNAGCSPADSNVWAYPHDRPIWATSRSNFKDLVSHGTTVHVAHPSLFPSFDNADRLRIQSFDKLIREMRSVRASMPGVQFLIFLELNRTINSQTILAEKREILLRWVAILVDALERGGITSEGYWLYPIDEPRGKSFDLLVEIAKLIKSRFPTVNLYANPIHTYADTVSFEQLDSARNLIDLWQPTVQLAAIRLNFFRSLTARWWIFENPRSPAKSAGADFYRALGIKAWALGASGIGVWSYSDTGRSSAWDDFDGNRPDWSMVYEGRFEPVASRRWESYAAGLEDWLLGCTADHYLGERSLEVLRAHALSNLDNANLLIELTDALRARLRKQ